MIQRFLFDALKDGIAQITADLTLLDQIFEEVYELEASEIAAIKAFWTNADGKAGLGPPTLRHGYAPRDTVIPIYSIILSSENEALTWLNNDSGQVEDPEDVDFGADLKGSIWNHRYDILVYHEHPDVVTYLYEIAKSILLVSMDFFSDKGLFDIDLGGSDLTPPEMTYIPEHLFARKLSFAAQRCFTRIDRDSRDGKAFKVGGMHVEGGSDSDVGGVKTLITTADDAS